MALSLRRLGSPALLALSLLAVLVVAPSAGAEAPYGTPENGIQTLPGWHLAGSAREKYDVKLDSTTKHGGATAAKLASTTANVDGFGTIMQSIDATPYRGKRLRMAAWLKTKDVAPWSGLWMRVDGDASTTAFDNMENRAIKGTTDWTRYDVVLDVAKDARSISFGTLLVGTGALWIDDVELHEVGSDVEVTSRRPSNSGPRPAPKPMPTNLSFEFTPVSGAR